MRDRSVYLECKCHTPDHLVRVWLDPGDDVTAPELILEPMMNPQYGFFRRLWVSLKYIFRPHGTRLYWHWDSVLLDADQVNKLSSLIVSYRLIEKLRKLKKNGRKT